MSMSSFWVPDEAIPPLRLEPNFATALVQVKQAVEAHLTSFLTHATAEAATRSPAVGAVAESVRALTTRGGKRFRAFLLLTAYASLTRSSDAWPDCGGALSAASALELLQTYFLIHDDWMDGDVIRRGGPTAHCWLREQVGEPHLGDSLGILAGDLACAWAQRLLAESPLPAPCVHAALAELARMQVDVIQGQVLDMTGTQPRHGGDGSLEVALEAQETLYHLKTGRYTVGGPLRLGALLAGARPEALDGLEAFAQPLGIAFQLRDDLLGLFGSADVTGKAVGSDLRAGKHTWLMQHALRDPDLQPLLTSVFGRSDADPSAIERALEALAVHPARACTEARLEALCAQARHALTRLELHPTGKTLLDAAVAALAWRTQ